MSFYVYLADDGAQTYPMTLTDLRRMRPEVSFPTDMTDADAAPFGFHPVLETPQPAGKFQTLERSALRVDGVWVEKWAATPWTQAQINAATEQQWSVIRAERNLRLAACDWTQLPDAPVDADAWVSYRQALRDITEQSDPFNIVWPETPAA